MTAAALQARASAGSRPCIAPSDQLDAPLRPILLEAVGRLRLGESPQSAFGRLAERVPLETFRLFSMIVATQWHAGGSLQGTLASVGDFMQDRVDVQQRIAAQSAPTRSSTFVLFAATAAIAYFSWTNDPFNLERFIRSETGACARRGITLALQGDRAGLDGSADADVAYDLRRCRHRILGVHRGDRPRACCSMGGARVHPAPCAPRGRRASRRGSSRTRTTTAAPSNGERSEVSSERASDRPLSRCGWSRAGHRGARTRSATFLLVASSDAVPRSLWLFVVGNARTSGVSTAQLSALFWRDLPVVGPGFGEPDRGGAMGRWPWRWSRRLPVAARAAAIATRRVEAIEQDLPLVLELLATLAEAGFGFESAVGEVIRAQAVRPTRSPTSSASTSSRSRPGRGGAESLAQARCPRGPARRSGRSRQRADPRRRHGREHRRVSCVRRPVSFDSEASRARAGGRGGPAREAGRAAPRSASCRGCWSGRSGPAFFQLFEMIDAAFG